MAIVNGKNVTVLIFENEGWRLYACARGCTLSVSTSTIETSTTGSGTWASFMAQKHSWTGTIDGVVNLDEPGQLTLADLRYKQIQMTPILIRFEREDRDGNFYTDEGTAIIVNSSDDGNIEDVANFTIELQGSGLLNQIFVPTIIDDEGEVIRFPLAVKRYPPIDDLISANGGETIIVISQLIGKDILAVHKDGIGNCAIITTGVPTDKQVLYHTYSGTFTWAIPFEPFETYYILYQDM